MKKILTFIFIYFCLIFVPVMPVSASGASGGIIGDLISGSSTEENNDTTLPDFNKNDVTKDDTGHFTSGNYCFYWPGAKKKFNYILTAESGLYIIHEKAGGYVVYTCDKQRFSVNGTEIIGDSAVTTIDERTLSSGTGFGTMKTENEFYTTIPVFNEASDTLNEDIAAYVESGDYTGAENADEINKKFSETNSNIQLPQNFLVTGGYASGLSSAYTLDKDLVVNWSQTVDTKDFLYDIDIQLVMECVQSDSILHPSDSGSALGNGFYFSSGWVSFASSVHYDSVTQIIRRFSDKSLNDGLMELALQDYVNKTGEKLKYKEYMINSLKIRVRNRVGTSASNYVVTTIDYKGSTTTAVVEDENGKIVEDEQYNGNDVSGKDEAEISSDISLVGIINYIRSGFGLLGNSGILALMSGVFSYVPVDIWTLIKMAISVTISVMFISLVKRFVFG